MILEIMESRCSTLLFFLSIINLSIQQNPSLNTFKLPANYSKEQRPSHEGEVTQVVVNVHVQAINPIKAADMDFRMDMTLTQRWTDDRLHFDEVWFDGRDHLILPAELVDLIWDPHPFIVNAKSSDVGQLVQKLVSVHIFRNHTVQYSINVFATVACAMNYRFYPVDSQLCPMYLESFSFDETQVNYLWAEIEAFTINPKLRMLQFEPRRPLHYGMDSVVRYNEGKNFSQLIAYFRFDRLLGNHLIQTFAPCSLVVCLSWFSFWLGLNALSARMSLLVTSVLTLVTQFVGLKTDLPPVAYVKAVDVWMAGCMVWVFGALGEFVVVKVIYSFTEDARSRYHHTSQMKLFDEGGINNVKDKEEEEEDPDAVLVAGRHLAGGSANKTIRQRRRLSMDNSSNNLKATEMDNHSISIASTNSATLHKRLGKVSLPLQWTNAKTGKQVVLWKNIDNLSKWLFPTSFLVFCTFYWMVLYIHSTSDIDLDAMMAMKAIDLNTTLSPQHNTTLL